jgi:hypothetical protein
MSESLEEICGFLADPSLTVHELAPKLGTLIEDQGGNLALIIRPKHPCFARAMVTRQYGTQRPATVELALAESVDLSVETLKESFGDYLLLGRQLGDKAPRIKFYLGEPTEIGSASIIATLMPDQWDNIEDGTVAELTLQPEF